MIKRIIKVIRILWEENMHVCTKFNGKPSTSCGDISLKTTATIFNLMVALEVDIIPWGSWMSVQNVEAISSMQMLLQYFSLDPTDRAIHRTTTRAWLKKDDPKYRLWKIKIHIYFRCFITHIVTTFYENWSASNPHIKSVITFEGKRATEGTGADRCVWGKTRHATISSQAWFIWNSQVLNNHNKS